MVVSGGVGFGRVHACLRGKLWLLEARRATEKSWFLVTRRASGIDRDARVLDASDASRSEPLAPGPRRKRAQRSRNLRPRPILFHKPSSSRGVFSSLRHTSARAAGARRDPRPVRRFPRGVRDLGHAAEEPCPREPERSPPRLTRSRDVFRGPPRARRADDFASPGRARPLLAPRDVPRLRRGARGDRRVRGDARARAVARRAAPPRPRRGTTF